ncbi:MAG: integrase core domain-containing protein [Calditrichia bacterium]|nr:integrase core domain-containing protein [Calditrichia bacterium]
MLKLAVKLVFGIFRLIFKNRNNLIFENLALRQQLAVQRRNIKRPCLRNRDRFFWALLSQIWTDWKSTLLIVKPETVVKWHRQGFKLYWRWKSKSKPGRPRISKEIRDLIKRMVHENPYWGAPRIHSELYLLGYDIAESTISKYLLRTPQPPSQTWKTFLKNHVDQTASIDFFTVLTVTFQILYCFIILWHEKRKIVHFNITTNPSSLWTAQQIKEAFPYDQSPKYLLRDRDAIYGHVFQQTINNMGIKEVVTAAKSPWQNPFVERLIDSIRRECLDHVIIFNRKHLHRILTSYREYYLNVRTHLSLAKNSPVPRKIEPKSKGKVIAIEQVGGLHHLYKRVA